MGTLYLPIQERDSNNNVLVTYTRGLDLSDSLQGAGGIGGLLARTDANGSTFYHSDGAGNVTALMDGQEDIVARYMYCPFGKLIGQWGSMANANEMQFSSMPRDSLSGLSFYPFRAYEPNFQRWLNQDPIQEIGGINLYCFTFNDPLFFVDPAGLSTYFDENYGDISSYQNPAALPVAGAMAACGVTTAAIAAFQPEALPAWAEYLWAAGAGAGGGYVGNGTANELSGKPFNQNAGAAIALGAALGAAGKAVGQAAKALKPCPTKMGKGIVNNGKVVAHEPIESVTSHEKLAKQSGTLLTPPQAGTPGELMPGAEAFTYSAQGGNVFVTGSMNFNSNVSENTVQVVTAYVTGQQ